LCLITHFVDAKVWDIPCWSQNKLFYHIRQGSWESPFSSQTAKSQANCKNSCICIWFFTQCFPRFNIFASLYKCNWKHCLNLSSLLAQVTWLYHSALISIRTLFWCITCKPTHTYWEVTLNLLNPKLVELSKGDVPAMIENLNDVVKGLR